MKPERERINGQQGAFRILLDPNLNDVFYWHFHPEMEIVYVEAEEGYRHIGDHLSRYHGSDLALIGPNIPHLNFDYGVKTRVGTVVVQMMEDFLGKDFLMLPEMEAIRNLFQRCRSGLAFGERTKSEAGVRLKSLMHLEPFQRLVALLDVLHLLARAEDVIDLRAKPVANAGERREQHRLNQVYRFVEEHFQTELTVHQAADLCCMTTPAFCRYFRKVSGHTFTDFVQRYRINHARKYLMQDRSAAEVCELSGFKNFSHFSKTFRKLTGESPTSFRIAARAADSDGRI